MSEVNFPVWILPGLGQSSSPTTYLERFLSPSRKETTRSRMSSALLEVNVYSSPLMVASVKLWPCSLPPLEDGSSRETKKRLNWDYGTLHALANV